MFPFDILATKDGVKYGINVSLEARKRLNGKINVLVKYLDLKYGVLHIKPDYSYIAAIMDK
jgi:hypothetical protein